MVCVVGNFILLDFRFVHLTIYHKSNNIYWIYISLIAVSLMKSVLDISMFVFGEYGTIKILWHYVIDIFSSLTYRGTLPLLVFTLCLTHFLDKKEINYM
jgi:hypothetical protein